MVGDWLKANSSNNELTESHTEGSEEQELSSAPSINQVQTGESGGDVDARGDQTDGETVADTRLLEERSSVVENEVDTGQLLKGLKTTTSSETLAKIALEAVNVGGLSEGQFVLVVGGDLSQLGLDSGVIDIETSQLGERASGLFVLALLDVESRGLGKNEQTTEQDDCPGELNSERNTVTSSVLTVLGGIANDRGKQ